MGDVAGDLGKRPPVDGWLGTFSLVCVALGLGDQAGDRVCEIGGVGSDDGP